MMQRAGLAIALFVLAFAPIGAGATGQGSLAMLAFAGVLFLANAVIRPGETRLDAPGQLVAQVLTAAAFSALLVGLGQILRVVGRIETEIDLVGWLVLAAWGIVLGRLMWRRSTGERAMKGAETALRAVHRSGEKASGRAGPQRSADSGAGASGAAKPGTVDTDTARRQAPPQKAPAPALPHEADPALAEALARLNDLPETGVSEARLAKALTTVSGAAPPERVFAALCARAPHSPRDRLALVLHATDPWAAERRAGQGQPAQAFEEVVSAADAVALGAFGARALALLDEIESARHDMPEVPRLLEIADQIEDDLEAEAELLVALAHALEDLAIEAENEGGNGADA